MNIAYTYRSSTVSVRLISGSPTLNSVSLFSYMPPYYSYKNPSLLYNLKIEKHVASVYFVSFLFCFSFKHFAG